MSSAKGLLWVIVSYKFLQVQFSKRSSPLEISWSYIKACSYQGQFSKDLCYQSTTIKHKMWDLSDQKQMPTYMHTSYQIFIYHTLSSRFPLEWEIPSQNASHPNVDSGSRRALEKHFLSADQRENWGWQGDSSRTLLHWIWTFICSLFSHKRT